MQWRKLSKIVTLALCLSCNSAPPQHKTGLNLEYDVAGLIDAYTLAQVADSFQIPHSVFYGIAWQETRGGNFDYRFPRGPGILVNSKKICRETGRMQMSPCIDWAKMLNDPICTNKNLLALDKVFAYQVNLHCAAKHLAGLHTTMPWTEAIRRYNGDGRLSYIYLGSVLAYIGQFYLKLAE